MERLNLMRLQGFEIFRLVLSKGVLGSVQNFIVSGAPNEHTSVLIPGKAVWLVGQMDRFD